ncbi:MAG: O-antigen ligase family protein [bacterium]|nr:O-antigen ligase family protein [bacterium]
MFITLRSLGINYSAFILLLTAIVIGELGRFHLFGNLYLSLLDLTAVAFLIISIKPWQSELSEVQKKYLFCVFCLFFTMIFTLIVHASTVPLKELLVALLYPLRWLIISCVPIGVVQLYRDAPLRFYIVKEVFGKMLILLALFGFIQLLLFPNLGILEQYGFDPHYLRLTSTWLDPNYVGGAFVLGMAVFLSKTKQTRYTIVSIVILFIALLCTFSRSSYLFFGVTGVTLALLRRSWRLGLFVIFGASLLYLVFAIPRQNLEKSRNIDRYVSASSRIISYSQGMQIFEDSPLIGVGYNLIRYTKRQYGMISDIREGGNSGAGIDSSWILILATTGILGFIVFLAYWIRIAYFIVEPVTVKESHLLKSTFKYINNATSYEHALLAFLIGWSVHSWFVNSLFFTPLLALWGIALGIALSEKLK